MARGSAASVKTRPFAAVSKKIYLAAILVALAAAGFLATTLTSSHPRVTVTQRNRHFLPDAITVTAGTVIHILNGDTVTHHIYVKQPEMNFSSGEQPVGKAVDVLFDQKGVFDVRCAIHPTMHLKVTVR